jgi:isocitrate dehydrogenase (NAD+)
MGDGLFIKTCREIALKYPQINYQEEQVDTICMKLARDPHELDVMVMPNLYGDIVSDLCAGKTINDPINENRFNWRSWFDFFW